MGFVFGFVFFFKVPKCIGSLMKLICFAAIYNKTAPLISVLPLYQFRDSRCSWFSA